MRQPEVALPSGFPAITRCQPLRQPVDGEACCRTSSCRPLQLPPATPGTATGPACRASASTRFRAQTSGAAATTTYAWAHGEAAVIPPQAWAGGLAAALVIGALAGLLPAIRAARLSPTQALWSI
jgi:hypothetical protein